MLQLQHVGGATEQLEALAHLRGVKHAFISRIRGIDVAHDKATALLHLDEAHHLARQSLGVDHWPLITAEQVHSDEIGIVDSPVTRDVHLPGCDGLISNQRGVLLGIHVADCAAVYLVDRQRRGFGLVHSGRKGTELAIAAKAVRLLRETFAVGEGDIVAAISPCIRPPHYEVDFAAAIREQLRAAGVAGIHDDAVCTACDLGRFYSYRAEKGKTGRMLALLGIAPG